MASLQGTKIKDTFKSILKVADNGEIEVTSQEITDGLGTGTGVSLNTSGDVIATGTVSFDSLKDTDENITITKFVDEADGIAANDNDTSIPTSAAVKDYVDNNITAQDLDITDGTNVGAVDLDSQLLTFTGDAGVSATVSNQTVTFNSSALQSQITNNDTDITNLQTADATLQSNIDAEESARIAADTALQTQITNNDTDITALQAADTTLQNNIDAEEAARIAADTTLQTNITAEATTRANADTTLQGNINTEEAARIAADTTLQTNINTEASTRASADTSLQNQITSNDGDITGLDTRLTTAEGNITSNDSDISALQSGKQDVSEKNQANGYAPLDAGAKVPIANLPDSVVGQVEYQGTYNASTDTPTLPAASTVKGHYYVVSVAGTYETISYAVGDWIISNGTAWEKVDNTDAVTTVFGRLGAVVANESDYSSFYPLISDLNTTNSNVSGLDGRLTTAEGDITAIETKTDFITVTQAVNLDTIESDVTTNNAKISFDSASSSKLAGIEAGAEVNTVDSVNSQTGVVVLDADDIDDTSTTHKFTSQTDIDKLAGIEALADVTDATNVAAAGALMSGTAVLSDLVGVSSTAPADGQVLTFDTVNGWQPEDSQGEEYTISEISTNTNAQVGFLYVLTANLTLTLPASPSVGDKVALSNMSGTTTPTVARNGNLIAGLAEDLTIDVLNLSVEFIYSGAGQGWIIFVDSILGTSGGGGSVDGNGTTNYISKWSDANTLTDSVIFDNGTNVGIGTTSPTDYSAFGYRTLEVSGSSIDRTGALILSDSAGTIGGALIANEVTGLELVQPLNRPLLFYTNNTEKVRILSSGGITFNGDTAAANALDDYEEGTWTMGISFGGNAVGATYSLNTGTYTKIGRQVTATGYLIITDKGSSTGVAEITGLPYTVNAGDPFYPAASIGYLAGVSFADTLMAAGVVNTTKISFYETTNGGVATTITDADFTNGSSIIITMTYFTA
jgi:hypothetical protein